MLATCEWKQFSVGNCWRFSGYTPAQHLLNVFFFLSSHGHLLQLSIWDLRMNNNGGCVQRISGSIGDVIYSVCSSPSGPIATGGTDRAVTIYDPRRLVWFCCLVLMIIWATAYKNALCLSCASRTFYSFFLLYPVWRMGIKTVRAFSQLVESI